MVGEILGTLGVVVGALSGLYAWLAPKGLNESTLRAFKRLEADVDDMFERVESHLGRVSRLKREVQAKEASATISNIPEAATRAQLLARHRRANAVTNITRNAG